MKVSRRVRAEKRARGAEVNASIAPRRHGITVPFDGITLAEHRDVFRELVDLGYTDVWSAESGGADAFTPLVLAAAWAPELRLGTAIIPVYTRGAMTLASQIASLCGANPGHFAVGIGSSSNWRPCV